MEANCTSRFGVKPGEPVVVKEHFHRPIQEHVDIDAFMSPRDEGRALGKGQDRALKDHGVVLGQPPAGT